MKPAVWDFAKKQMIMTMICDKEFKDHISYYMGDFMWKYFIESLHKQVS